MGVNCDIHIHTIASGHAFNTIDECINYAHSLGYVLIGIAEHGPDMEGAPHYGYFDMLYRLPKCKAEMKIIYGCEANIINTAGKTDISASMVQHLDYVMAGLHARTSYADNDIISNTKALVNAISSERIDIITHPVSKRFEIDVREVVNASAQYPTILEANKTVMLEAIRFNDKTVVKNYCELITLAKNKNVDIVFGSDAHHNSEMGLSEEDEEILRREYGFKLSSALNSKVDVLLGKL